MGGGGSWEHGLTLLVSGSKLLAGSVCCRKGVLEGVSQV